jgi:Uma2 family endonuclease
MPTVPSDATLRKIEAIPKLKFKTYADYARLTPPDCLNFELRNGRIVYVPSHPYAQHEPANNLRMGLWEYRKKHKNGLFMGLPMDVHLTEHDVFQPDMFYILEENKNIITNEKINGAPDLVIEFFNTNCVGKDMSYKHYVYEIAGVREYWVLNPEKKTLTQYTLIEDELRFQRTLTIADTLKSLVLRDFKMPVAAVFE